MTVRTRELASAVAVSALLTIALTYPLAFQLGHVGRVDNGDGQLSIWNVAWVARTLVVDPVHVFDANIFYPHRWTLSYSESNLGAGALAIPAYWASGRNPYAGHNSVVLLAFVLSTLGAYYLVRYLTGDRRAAAVSAVCFGFTPFVLAHTSHIQLLMTAGLPFTMLAFHRLTDAPRPSRGAVLGAVMAAQAICCGYYGVFVMLMVGLAVLLVAAFRGRWTDRAYWVAVVVAAVVALGLVIPPFLPYLWLQRDLGFGRGLDEARRYSANWSAYLASASYAHAWMLPHLPPRTDAVFPGFVATILGVAGIRLARRVRGGELSFVYGTIAGLALWTSLGPAAGLYTVLYRLVPVFTLLRAPVRFGIVVSLALSVLAGGTVAAVLPRIRRASAVGIAIAALAVGELMVPLQLPQALELDPVYAFLARQPRGAVIELPFYYPQVGLFQHAKYMLASTSHWMPLVNGYSDYIPPDFMANVMTLASFPSRDSLQAMESVRVRYALFHMYGYNDDGRALVLGRIRELAPYLRPLYVTEYSRLYEIVGSPP